MRRRTQPRCLPWRLVVWGLLGIGLLGPAKAIAAEPPVLTPLDVSKLREIERRILPPCLAPGAPQHTELADYYWAENPHLRARFAAARDRYEKEGPRPYRVLTLVAGNAGVGKTFIKREIFSRDYAEEVVCSFDIRQLYEAWQAEGLVESRPDLADGDIVLSHMLAAKRNRRPDLCAYLESRSASFYVIDSLDEIHPDDYVSVLKQIENFVSHTERRFVHVVVLGRPLAFRDFWQQYSGNRPEQQLALLLLEPPRFRTTGDLLVSTWNYHTWRYKLQWATDRGELQTMPLDMYTKWVSGGFADSAATLGIRYEPNRCMNAAVYATLESWALRYPVVGGMLYNLAGNTMAREIVEPYALEGRPYDERAVMEAYLAKWLQRETKSEGRPSDTQQQQLDLYLRLLEAVAVKYLGDPNALDSDGRFGVGPDDMIRIDWEGRQLSFPVSRILDRSGLKDLDPRTAGEPRYRFEPVWFHRLLVEKHNDLCGLTKLAVGASKIDSAD